MTNTMAIEWTKVEDGVQGMPAGMTPEAAEEAGLFWHAEKTKGKRYILRRAGDDAEVKCKNVEEVKAAAEGQYASLYGAMVDATESPDDEAVEGNSFDNMEACEAGFHDVTEDPVKDVPQGVVLAWHGPSDPETVGLSVVRYWRTYTDVYFVSRRETPDGAVKFAAQLANETNPSKPGLSVDPGKPGSTYAKTYPTLRAAIEACESDLMMKSGQAVISNREDVLKAAADLALAGKASVPAPAPKAPGSVNGAKKPGVIDAIIAMLTEASEDAPLGKDTAADRLAVLFPDRDRDGMKSTYSTQVGRLKTKGHDVRSNKSGYWIAK